MNHVLAVILGCVLPALLVISAACSASETALFSLSHADRLRLRRANPKVFAAVTAMLAEPRSLLVTILLTNTAANTAFMVASTLVGASFGPAVAAAVGVGAVLAVIVFGEVLPKSIAAVHRVAVSRFLAGPTHVWYRSIGPVRVFADRYLVAPLARVIVPEGHAAGVLTSADLSSLLDAAARTGVLDGDERRLLDDVVHLSAIRVRDVMTPRVDIQWLDAGATAEDLLSISRDTGHSRFPVCRGTLDEETILGVASVSRILPMLASGSPAKTPLVPVLEPARYVPERARLDQLLDHFRGTRTTVAMSVNELGDLTGIVTLADVIEELVAGSASGRADDADQVRRIGDGRWEVPGRLSVRDWSEVFGRDEQIPSRVATVAGLVLYRLGRVPRVGNQVRVRNLVLQVEEMSGREIVRVSVALVEPVGVEGAA